MNWRRIKRNRRKARLAAGASRRTAYQWPKNDKR
jgi:hypothetical protein